MKQRIFMAVMMLFVISWPATSIDPIYLGTGQGDKVINLDAGVKQPHQNYNFGKLGFVTPKTPQPMALSSSMMINQAKDLRDEVEAIRDDAITAKNEAVAARDEARAEHDAARTLLTKIEEKERRIEALQKSIESSAEASSINAAKGEDYLAKTTETYGRVLQVSIEVDKNLSLMRTLVDEARFYANESMEKQYNSSLFPLFIPMPIGKKS